MEQINTTVPLAWLALELATTVEELTARLDGEVVRDDVGMRAVPRDVACRLLVAKVEEERRTQEIWQRQQAELVRRGREAQAGVASGVAPPAGLEGLSAVQLLGLGQAEEKLDTAGARWQELVTGSKLLPPRAGGE
jgi:hypothetical protein